MSAPFILLEDAVHSLEGQPLEVQAQILVPIINDRPSLLFIMAWLPLKLDGFQLSSSPISAPSSPAQSL